MSLALATLRPTAPPPGAALARLTGRASAWLAAWRAGVPAFFATGALFLVAALPLAAAALVDGRTVLGADAWLKPLKLAVALGIRAFTLALFSRAPAPGFAGRRGFRAFRAAVIFAVRAELAWIAGAASHVNAEGLWAALYPVAGILATVLTSASAVLAWGVARNRRPALSPALRDGLALVLPPTPITAGTLSGNGGHLVGAATDAGGPPFLGWSREVGDLRAAHVLATDAMHAAPAFALASSLALGGHRRAPVCAFAAAWTGLVAFAFPQALAGRPYVAGAGCSVRPPRRFRPRGWRRRVAGRWRGAGGPAPTWRREQAHAPPERVPRRRGRPRAVATPGLAARWCAP